MYGLPVKMKNLLLASSLLGLSMSGLYAVGSEERKLALVSIEEVREKKVAPTTWLSGNVVSRENARISSEQNGRLIWMLDIGDQVNKGDIIAKLDAADLELQLKESAARERSQLANIDFLKKQKLRLTALINNNSNARIELDRTERDLIMAQEELVVLSMRIRQIALALNKTKITAPFDGIINQRIAQPGEYVSVGTNLIQLVNPRNLDISVAAPLSLAKFIQVGTPVMVSWDDKLKAVPIRTWSPAGEQSSRTFNLRLDASKTSLIIGSGVSVSVPSALAKQSTLVPRDALVLRDKEIFVLKVSSENIAQKISVLIGQGIGDWVSVIGQISTGDKVVVRGGERLQPGQKVRIAADESNSASSSIASNL